MIAASPLDIICAEDTSALQRSALGHILVVIWDQIVITKNNVKKGCELAVVRGDMTAGAPSRDIHPPWICSIIVSIAELTAVCICWARGSSSQRAPSSEIPSGSMNALTFSACYPNRLQTRSHRTPSRNSSNGSFAK